MKHEFNVLIFLNINGGYILTIMKNKSKNLTCCSKSTWHLATDPELAIWPCRQEPILHIRTMWENAIFNLNAPVSVCNCTKVWTTKVSVEPHPMESRCMKIHHMGGHQRARKGEKKTSWACDRCRQWSRSINRTLLVYCSSCWNQFIMKMLDTKVWGQITALLPGSSASDFGGHFWLLYVPWKNIMNREKLPFADHNTSAAHWLKCLVARGNMSTCQWWRGHVYEDRIWFVWATSSMLNFLKTKL